MQFSQIPLIDKKYYNFIFMGLSIDRKSVVAMFDTSGNTLIKESMAKDLDLSYIDDAYIDESKGFRRAYLKSMQIGGLKLQKVPVLTCKDELLNLAKDNKGNSFPADIILGYNLISQFVFRGDLRNSILEVQVSDFKDIKNKEKTNMPVFNVGFNGKIIKASLDSSKVYTRIARSLYDMIDIRKDFKDTIDMLELGKEEILYKDMYEFDFDGEKVSLATTRVDDSLDDTDNKIIFGADLLTTTKWALYNPSRFIRVNNY